MNELFDMTIEGDRELQKLFTDLPTRLQVKALRPTMKKGAQMVQASARKHIRKSPGTDDMPDTGMLAKSLRVVQMKARKGSVGYKIQPQTIEAVPTKRGGIKFRIKPKKRRGGGAIARRKFYAFAVERGFVHWKSKKHIAAKPFMRPARIAMHRQVVNMARDAVAYAIAQAKFGKVGAAVGRFLGLLR